MELRNRLEAALGRSLSATLAWNHPTIGALVEHLAGLVGGEVPGPAPRASDAVPSAAANVAVGEVSELSDEEAAAALRAGRSGGTR